MFSPMANIQQNIVELARSIRTRSWSDLHYASSFFTMNLLHILLFMFFFYFQYFFLFTFLRYFSQRSTHPFHSHVLSFRIPYSFSFEYMKYGRDSASDARKLNEDVGLVNWLVAWWSIHQSNKSVEIINSKHHTHINSIRYTSEN